MSLTATMALLGEIRAVLRSSVCPEDRRTFERTREDLLALHDELLELLLRPPGHHGAEVRRLLGCAH